MRYKPFLITWAALWIVGLVFLVAGFNGEMSVNFGSSLQSNTFKLCGATTGWLAVIGLLSILAGVAMLIVALVALGSERLKA
jgi:hypothetical protein